MGLYSFTRRGLPPAPDFCGQLLLLIIRLGVKPLTNKLLKWLLTRLSLFQSRET